MKIERAAPWLAGLVLAAPILLFRYPPMGDLAMHEALVAILRFHDDPTFAPAGLYEVVAPQANQLFHWLAYLLSFALGTTLACKVVIAAAVLLTPVLTARWLASLGRSRWPSLLVAPIACGWMFRWGLVSNLLGFVLLIGTLPLLERLAKRPSPRLASIVSLAGALVFFAHESSAFVVALIGGYFAVVRAGKPPVFAVRMVPLAAILACAYAQMDAGKRLASANMTEIGSDYGIDPLERLADLPGAVFGGYDHTRLAIIGVAWLAALVASAVARSRPAHAVLRPRVAFWRYRHGVLAAVFAFFYLGFPMSIAGTTLLAFRFLPPAILFLAAAVAPDERSYSKGGRVLPRALLAAVVPLAMLGIELKSFWITSRAVEAIDELAALVPKNVAVAQLDLTPLGPTTFGPIPGAANRVLTAKGGRMLFAFTDTPPNPVYIRRDARWNEPISRMALAPYELRPAYDATRFSYLLARNTKPRIRALALQALRPDFELVASRGDWDLLRSTAKTDPLDSPDRALPTPAPETLVERVNRLLPPK